MGREAGTPAWGGRCRAASSGGGAWSVFRSRRLTEPPLAACLGRGFYAQPLKSGRKMHQGKKELWRRILTPRGPILPHRGAGTTPQLSRKIDGDALIPAMEMGNGLACPHQRRSVRNRLGRGPEIHGGLHRPLA